MIYIIIILLVLGFVGCGDDNSIIEPTDKDIGITGKYIANQKTRVDGSITYDTLYIEYINQDSIQASSLDVMGYYKGEYNKEKTSFKGIAVSGKDWAYWDSSYIELSLDNTKQNINWKVKNRLRPKGKEFYYEEISGIAKRHNKN